MTMPTDDRPRDWMKTSTITGLVALVVGGGSGIGASCARTFAANDGTVLVADRDEEAAQRVAAEIAATGANAIAMTLDIAKEADVKAAVARLEDEFGRLDVLINVAARVEPAMLEDADRAIWEAAFDVNVWGALDLARSCLPLLKRSPCPAIVLAASHAGLHGYANSGSYGPSKAAVVTLARQMALELAVHGIRVNVVVPGTVWTPALSRDASEIAIRTREGQVPLGRLSLASEQADAAVFLGSPAASFITGQCLIVDGGFGHNLFPHPMRMNETLRERAARLDPP